MENQNKYQPVVIDAEYCNDFCIKVTFSNGIAKTVDCKKYLKGIIFEPLHNEEYFKKFFVDGWTISWPNGADIAPDTLYYYS
jgi:hypothetical protein